MPIQYTCQHCHCTFARRLSRAGPYCSHACRDGANALRAKRGLAERFWSKVNKDGSVSEYRPDLGPCWEWQASLNSSGYGQFNASHNRPTGAHRIAYELTYGAIPDGKIIDHLCRNILCVRPSHLEAVTYAENSARGECPAWVAHVTNQCKRGHPFTDANTMVRTSPQGTLWRQCRTCTNANRLWRYHAKKRTA